jgi:AcrR family transcriptional regulator
VYQQAENTSGNPRAVPTTRKGKQTYNRQLAAASIVFARDGFADTTMSGVAEEAGVSLGGVYRYFTDKDDLFMATIQGLHEQLFESSGHPKHSLGRDPYSAIRDSNAGYLHYYHANSGLMRTFMEAAMREPRFRDFWRYMRNRHIDRFIGAYSKHYGIDDADISHARHLTEAAACMTEQGAYVWFAQSELRTNPIKLEEATNIVTQCWYSLFFGNDPKNPVPAFVCETDLSKRFSWPERGLTPGRAS